MGVMIGGQSAIRMTSQLGASCNVNEGIGISSAVSDQAGDKSLHRSQVIMAGGDGHLLCDVFTLIHQPVGQFRRAEARSSVETATFARGFDSIEGDPNMLRSISLRFQIRPTGVSMSGLGSGMFG